ncbi:MAG: DUF763 domain-containing protein [Thermoplasmata archaeon]
MYKTGVANLPLHGGSAPRWLFSRMVKLSNAVATIIVDEYGRDELLRRVSDPFWFQAFSCVIGFDWHSSGTTTVTCGALKEALKDGSCGVVAVGGKGAISRRVPSEIEDASGALSLSSDKVEKLKYASKMSAKVDNALVQDSYQLYHHVMLITNDGGWTVIQQGMNMESKYARRYHWLGENIKSFVVEPHAAIMGNEKISAVLDMTAKQSDESRKISVDVAKEGDKKIQNSIRILKEPKQRTLDSWISRESKIEILYMPWKINWKALRQCYEFQPENYEELISIKGVGPTTVRALALISEVIYGEKPSWKDPVKYSFAIGGKDGVPYPIDRKIVDKTIGVLKKGIDDAKVGKEEKLAAIKRLRVFVPPDIKYE